MKFCATWKSEIMQLPYALQCHVLSYKKWKKLSVAHYCANDLIQRLEEDCFEINKTMKDAMHHIIHPSQAQPNLFCIPIFRTSKVVDSSNVWMDIQWKDLYTYAMLNKTTLYKICKRMDKRRASNAFRQWRMHHFKDYYFNHGMYLTRLYLESFSKDMECPICFEPLLNSNDCHFQQPVIILNCGHVLCVQCVAQLYNMTGKKGSFCNLLSVELSKGNACFCPMCRHLNPLIHISDVNIYPLKYKYLLNTTKIH